MRVTGPYPQARTHNLLAQQLKLSCAVSKIAWVTCDAIENEGWQPLVLCNRCHVK